MEVMEYLLGHGADVNAISIKGGTTPLMHACSRYVEGSLDFVRFLVERGADCEMVDTEGKRAVDHCKSEDVRLFLREAAEKAAMAGQYVLK